MSAPESLLLALRKKGVELWLEEGRLRYRAPTGVLGRDDIEQIRTEKARIIELLLAMETAERQALPLQRRRSEPAVLSFEQQRLWVIEQLESGGAAYHIPGGVRLHGRLDREALQAALDTVLLRHEALRTVFANVAGSPVQVISEDARFNLLFLDLSDRAKEASEAEVSRQASEEAQSRFDLSVGPLIRGRLIQLGAEEHVLLVTMHHIVSDGWSMGIFIKEVAQLYAAYRDGLSNPLTPLPIQYADYAVWQREWLQSGAVLDSHLNYWKEQLDGAPELLDLPTDRPRLAAQSYRGSSVGFALSGELAEQLKRFSRRHDATLFMTMYTGFAILLSRLSGQEDVVIGTPVANRQRTEVEGLIGFFVNTLALRTQLSGDPSVTALLQRVKATTLGAYSHQQLPFDQVVEMLQPVRSLSHSPVFQAMIVLRNMPQSRLELPGLTLLPQEVSTNTAQFDLTLSLFDDGQQVLGSMTYSSDLFDQRTVERWVEYFKAVLQGMVQDAERRVSAIQLLAQSEREQLIRGFNATEVAYPKHKLIHELFEEQVERTPDAIALTDAEEQLSYAALNRRANQVAHYLRAQGLQSGECVPVCMPRSLAMVVAQLAVLKIGGTYVPIDPELPASRQAFLLDDCRARWVIASEGAPNRTPVGVCWIDVVAAASGIARCASSNLNVESAGTNSPAYVMYTSGSTGEPKGVVVPHRAVVRLVINNGYAQIEPVDCLAHCSNPAFDASTFEIWGALLNGARLLVVSPSTVLDANHFADVLERQSVTVLWLTVGLFNQYSGALGRVFKRLRYLLVGGDVLDPSKIREVLRDSPPQQLLNGYGPTESTTFATTYRIVSVPEAMTSIPIGRPISNTRIYLLDGQHQPVPMGVAGEIYIGGDGVALGYLNRPELTKERFIPDPFGADPTARIYKTGDLGRFRPDGTIEYLGRNDHQVKIRGFRIELGEIEAQLRQHEQVEETVVVAREDMPGEKRLVAYLTHRAAAPSSDELRAYLIHHLPEYMIPSAYVPLSSLPLTPNGKLDRNALPAPELGAYAVKIYEAPQGEIESTLATIWQELLHVERVGRQDNFFELGGHSLLIVQLIERLHQLGLQAEVRSVFNSPTLSALASSLTRELRAAFQAPPNLIPAGCEAITPAMLPLIELTQAEIDVIVGTVPGGARNVQDIYPLAPLQEGILFHHVLNERSDAYVLPSLLALNSREQLDALLSAIQAVIDRHDVLRTAVLWKDLARPMQVVYRQAPLPVNELVLDRKQDPVTQLRNRMAPGQLRIDLQSGPLIRVEIAPGEDESWYALLYYHHIISDHVALEHILAEVDAHLAGQSATLPASIPYREYVAQALARAQTHDATAFFRSKLSEVDEPTAPFGLLNVQGDGSQIEEARQAIDAALSRRIRRSAQRWNVSPATLFHAAYALVIAHTSGRDDVVFGSVLLGRLHGASGVQHMLGMFINTLPLRLSLDPLTTEQLIERTQRELAALVDYEHASLAEAQRCSSIQGNAPLFTAVLNYRHSASAPGEPSDAEAGTAVVTGYERTNYPFAISVDDMGAGFAITAQIDRQIDAHRVTAYLRTAIESLVQALEGQPETPALQLSIMPASEREQLIRDFNATAVAYPKHKLIHELFEEQVERTPDAIAVVYEGRQLTYRELNQKSNQLAHYLRAQGVPSGDCVPVCMARSLRMVVAQLAILKVGCTYVPIDPDLPAERQAFMMGDCSARWVIASERAPEWLPMGGRWIDVTHDRSVIAHCPAGNLRHENSGSPAYVMYTSGSTGAPKGVLVPHRAVVRLVINNGYAQIDPSDCVVHCSNPAFDASTFELWSALLNGARVLIVPPATVLESERFATVLGEGRATILWLTVGLFNQYRDALRTVFERLRYLLVGGDVLDPRAIRQVLQDTPPRQLLNGYGPTECTTFAATYRIEAIPGGVTSIPIGRPINNTSIYILDRRRQPVPTGVVGEIYIGGDGVALGYLNRAELTAQRFLPDPFSTDPDARMYKTGDLGRWRADGNIEYAGRNDHQVKIRGFRIELGEIEAQLAQHAQVRDAVVLAREDASGQKRLVAYVTHREIAPSSDELRAHLRRHLPEYMIPSAYVSLPSLPYTPNGKLDRKALPAPELDAYAVKAYEAPRGEIEEALADIWQDLLHVERVGRHDNFFELGGHSLLIIQLLERLRRLGLRTTVSSVFEQPTLWALANGLSGLTVDTNEVPPNLIPIACDAITPEMLTLVSLNQLEIDRVVATVAGGAGNIQDIYPLAPLQEGILFHHLLNADGDTYVTPTLIGVESRPQLDAFLAALQAVVDRHDILRTAVLWEGLSQPVQVVYRRARLPVEEIELTAGEDSAELLRSRMTSQQLKMDIRYAPLLRIQMARDLSSERWNVLLLVHHIINDHIGQDIILAELKAHLSGRIERLTAPVAYRGFVAWALSQAKQPQSAAFFRDKLGDVEEPTAPFGLLDVHGDGSEVGQLRRRLAAVLSDRIRRTARRLRVSVASIFHAAWALVIARTSGRDDVVFGSVLSGRLQGKADADRVMGMLINTLPMRIRLRGISAEQLVTLVQREIVELLQHEQASLAMVQRCSGIKGSTPLFSAVLNYRHSALTHEPAASDQASDVPDGVHVLGWRERTNYPTIVSVDDLGEGFLVEAQIDRRIDPGRMVGYVEAALESLVDALDANPEKAALQLPILQDLEWQQLIHGFNATEVAYPKHKLIHELFEEQVERTPDAIAVLYEGQQLTYREINQKANQLAHYLHKHGVAPDRLVAICVERSVEMIVGLLGILKAGGAYVPLDPSYPRERLEYMLKDAAVSVVLTQARLKSELPESTASVIALDTQWTEIAQHSERNLSACELGLTSAHLAYVIYTSGSTGQPKGVMIAHTNVVNLWRGLDRAIYQQHTDCQRVGCNASFGFDASVQQFVQLLSGRTLVFVPEGVRRDASAWLDFVEQQRVDGIDCTPSQLVSLVSAGLLSGGRRTPKVMLVGGEAIDAALWRTLSQSSQIAFYNVYGPTECTVDATVGDVQRLPEVSIGRPLSNTQIYILDRHHQPVPLGVIGEIYIGGAGVARGYLNRPELTAERFIPDPFGADPSVHIYKTGDLGRYRPDGTIEYLGRNDHQVKIRGFRIELGEIEARLRQHQHVKEAVVIAREDVPGDKRLVAYVTCREATPSSDELRAHIKRHLPEYMVPSAYVPLASLPLTPNGKLDRKALPAPELEAYAVKAYEAPQGEIEAALATIWQELLHLERVGRQDNFFDLGGHSLLAVQLVSRIKQVLRRDVQLRELFDSPTVSALAKQVAATGELTLTPIVRADRSQSLPPSWAQQRLWFIDQLEGGGAAYHIPAGVRLHGGLDRAALQAALDTMLERHEALRTVFASVDGRPVQVITEEARFALQFLDLSGQAQAEREAQVARQATEEAQRRFDLSVGPLIRGRLIRLGADEHVLLVTMHHIVSDGWSMGIFIQEVAQLYAAYREGRTNPLASLPIQYADYALWQRGWLQGAVLEDQLHYWKEQLGGAPELLALPTDRPRPVVQSYRGSSIGFALSPELSDRLKRFSRQHDATLFMTLYTGFALMLSRLSGQDDVVIGTPVANRQRTEVEGLIGCFVNTLALRVRLSDDPSVSALLQQVKAMTLGAYSHQELPFEQVVEALQPARSLSHSPVFQAMLVLQNTPQGALELPGLTLSPQATASETARFDLALSLYDAEEQIVGNLNYASDLFDRATVERWGTYFQRALAGMVEDAEQKASAIRLLNDREREQLIRGFNATAVAYPKHKLIHELFEEQVERTPDAIAVVCEHEQLTYWELNQKANQLAHYLRNHGVAPDRLVAICVERSVEMVIGLLGVLKAGGAYVPLDPSYPRERLEYLLKDAAASVVLTQARLKSGLPESTASVIALDTQWTEIAQQPERNLSASELGLKSAHLAYVIYTSGSTGRPKGVMIEHTSVVNLWRGLEQAIYQQQPQCHRVGMNASFAFDASVKQFVQLLSGRTLVLIPEVVRLDVGAWLDFVVQQRVDGIDCTPSQLTSLVSAGMLSGGRHIPSVMLVGGEKVDAALWGTLSRSSKVAFYNVYGPTECTVDATVGCVKELPETSIGRPISNTHIYILDRHQAPVPLGTEGEIYIGGVGVARGYLNRPELTAERFVRDPFSTDVIARMYKTGDLGRFRPDGTIEYLGRNDHQVKIRGFRIELGEIEAQLCHHEQVTEAVVIAREDVPGEKRLVAYVAHRDPAPSSDELRAHIKRHLPEYMVPSAYVPLSSLPLTPNGKLDRKALPVPELEAYAVKTYEAPQGEIESALATIWQELLHLERVGRQDNFFDLGGHSLLAVQLVSRIKQVLRRDVQLRELFDSPTISALAKQVAATGELTLTPIVRADRNQALPPSWAQQRLWFIDQLESGGAAYHIPAGVRLHGGLDREALQAALDTMLERHEALRTVFASVDGRPVQVITEEARFALQFLDLSGQAQAEREAQVARQATEEAQRRFDLSVGPLIRGRLIRLGADEHVLLVTMHHIVSDGWSMGIFIQEVAQLYAAYREGRTNPLASLPIQYADYALWQRGWLQGAVLENQLSYWKEQLGGAPELLALPTDRPRPVVQSYRGSSIGFALSPELSDRLKRFSRQHDATLFMTLYTGFALVLSRLSGQDDVVIGTPVANRQRTEVEGLIGCFVNTLALRVRLSDDPSVSALLQQVKAMTLGAYSHQELPFEQVVEALQPARSLSHSPVFQAMLVLQNTPKGELELPGLTLSPQALSSDTAQVDLTLSLYDAEVQIVGSLNYASDLFDRATVERWVAYFERALAGMVENAEQKASAIRLLNDREREQLIRGFNATAAAYPKHKLIHELFEEQVERTPDAIAVVYEQEQLSYAELNRRANQLAHRLRARGVGPDRLVAICLDRSVEMIVGLLGILKAGGAYVPLDPSYPRERLEYMLKDAAASVVLTQAHLEAELPEGTASVIALDAQWTEIAQQPDRNLNASELGLKSAHLAYVIYTSGSTGQPKGAMNEHGAVVNRLYWMQDAYALNEHDRVLQKTPFSFDVSVWEFFWTLLNGARLVMARPQGHQDPSYLSEVIQASGITTVHFVPSMLQVFLAQGTAGQCGTLRHVVCSGEALSVELQNRCLACLPQAGLHNLYGPTEAAIDVTFWECRPEPAVSRVPIGRPISNTQIYILDRDHQPVPMGVAGEIYIGGAGVARGYLNRPELTAERFIPDPFGADPTARIYKSGDLGRFRPDGTIEYLGRNDHQVKIRGFRIELGEIEAQLCQHEKVEEAVVIAREDVPGEKRLVAYVTHGTAAAPEIDELRIHLKASLPEYMIPSAYVPLSSLPLTPNGKLDRKALPAPELGAYAVKIYEVPQGEIESALATIWQELLHVERVGRHDNFFELGGHSLLIVRLIERLRRLGLQAEVRSVFNSPTLSALASSLTSDVRAAFQAPPNLIPAGCEAITPAMLPLIELTQAEIDVIVSTVPGGAKNVQDIYPLAPLQEGILFHHVLNERSDAYVLPSLLALNSREQLDALLSAIQAVIDRHDILRTAVLWKDLGRPVQVVYRQAPLSVMELALDPAHELLAQLKHRMAPGQLRIDLQSGPLIRVEVAHGAEDEPWYALLYYHHIISDHVALEQILAEVDAHLAGRSATLPAPIPYREYVAQALARAQTQDATVFFRSKLSEIDEPTAPFGLLNVQGDGSQIEETREAVDSELSGRIRRSAKRWNVSPATLFHAAYALVVAHTSGRDDVVFGSVLLGRLHGASGVQHMLGMFINTLPLRLSLDQLTAEQLIERTQRELAALVEYEHASLAEAQRCSSIQGHAPLFSAVLNYRHSALVPTSEPSDGVSVLGGYERTNYPFAISVDDLSEGFAITAQIDRQIDARRVTAYLRTAIESLVQALEAHPEVLALQLCIVPASEREQLIHGFNATVEYRREQLIHELFEAQVERTPDAIAVTCEGQQLTYRELNRKSNQLAHYLRQHGVASERLVAICVDRSVEMVIGLLGILKAGGAYVPLDPSYPRERLEYMLKDAAASVVLTQARLESELPKSTASVIALDTQWAEIAQQSERNLSAAELGLKSAHLAYVIYTSGSTGQPKGALIEHANVVRLFAATEHWYGFSERDVWTLFHSIAFDFSVWELWGALLYGGRLVVVPQLTARSPQAFYRLVCEEGVTVLNQTPSAFTRLIAAQTAEPQVEHSLRWVIFGGEALELSSLQPWVARNGADRPCLVNMYGITETTVHVTYRALTREAIESERSSVVGRPIPDLRVYLLDAHRQPVPLGVVGEIYVGGAGVARGYLNRPELTAERFVRDPFSSDVTARMYKTGDLGRFRPDGTIEYLGRNDHQVKIRGFRIELGEIEARLRQHEHVEEAVVIAREDVPGHKRLVAYVTHQETTPGRDELRTHLKASLPEYMTPTAYVSLANLPLTPSGKLDRRALPAPELEAFAVNAYEAPQGEIEPALATIWQELLLVERVGRQDNFFELGGHSLLIVQLANRIQRDFRMALGLHELFAFPTLMSQAELIDNNRWIVRERPVGTTEEREVIEL